MLFYTVFLAALAAVADIVGALVFLPPLDKAGLTRSTYLDLRPSFFTLKARLTALPTLRLFIEEVSEVFFI